MKKLLVIIGLIVLILGFALFFIIQKEQQLTTEIHIDDIDISTLEDGTYNGQYNTNMVHVEVSVIIESGEINTIELLKHDNGKGTPAEAIINNIVHQNTLNVDTITGATTSSQVIRKAIEQALLKARRES